MDLYLKVQQAGKTGRNQHIIWLIIIFKILFVQENHPLKLPINGTNVRRPEEASLLQGLQVF